MEDFARLVLGMAFVFVCWGVGYVFGKKAGYDDRGRG